MTKPYRQKKPVLCIFEYIGREKGSTVTHEDSVMIQVEFDDQIMDEFERQMRLRFTHWSPVKHVGPRPLEWTLIKWLKPDGSVHYPPPVLRRVEPF